MSLLYQLSKQPFLFYYLYTNRIQFIYKSNTIYIQMENDLYINRKRSVYKLKLIII
ncbi:hypothetical protein HMPREF1988_01356 [Porphyromonas gingivalis F0185]|nr:hypothetical protein HMPREF1988_01356 [Porphyromonas gingivalis F0185]